MPEHIFDHLSDNARRFHECHTRWHVVYFHVMRDQMAASAVESVKKRKPLDTFWQAQAAFRYAREIERQEMEICV